MDSPETIGGTAAAAVLVYVWHRVRSEGVRRKEAEGIDKRWVDRMEKHAARTHDLASQISIVLLRMDRAEKRMDKADSEFEYHVAEDTKMHERVTRVEEQFGELRRGMADTKESVLGTKESVEKLQERTVELLTSVLQELRMMRAK